jgi:hypothetical protein
MEEKFNHQEHQEHQEGHQEKSILNPFFLLVPLECTPSVRHGN